MHFKDNGWTDSYTEKTKIEQLTSENKEMKELLSEIQHSDENLYCPCCGMGNYSGSSHKPDCKLAKFIKN